VRGTVFRMTRVSLTPDMILDAWKTNNRVTIFLVEHLPAELWQAAVPGAPRRTIRMLAGHIHNRYKVKPKDLIPALERSGAGILNLLKFGCDHGGTIPATSAYVWRNLPLDVGHVLGYFIAHEAHHRGQIVLLARQLGYRLPADVTGGLWQWSKRAREV
jgi:hypothetical protein